MSDGTDLKRSIDLFSPDATAGAVKQQLDALDTLPENDGRIGVVVQGTDVGVQGQANVDIGKPGGWSFAAAGAWFRQQGASAAGYFRWRGKD